MHSDIQYCLSCERRLLVTDYYEPVMDTLTSGQHVHGVMCIACMPPVMFAPRSPRKQLSPSDMRALVLAAYPDDALAMID